jgi:hypothetical protein
MTPRTGQERTAHTAPLVTTVAPTMVVAALVLATARRAAMPLRDPDTLWHVLAGRDLLAHWTFIGPDPLGTFTTEQWVRQQWLGELLMAIVARQWGLAGVGWLTAALQAALVIATYAACRRLAAPLPAALATVGAALGSSGALAARPQIVGMVLLAIAAGAWYGTTIDLRPRWWLVPFSWIWAMTHGTWVIGVVLGFVVLVGLLADRRLDRMAAVRLALLPTAAAVVPLFSPLNWHVYGGLLQVAAIRSYIAEWSAPSVDLWQLDVVLAMVVVVALIWIQRRVRVPWTSLLLLAVGVGWAMAYVRSIAIGAVVVAPLFGLGMGTVLGHARRHLTKAERGTLAVSGLTAVAIGALVAATSAPASEPLLSPAVRSSLNALGSGSVVLNTDALGGALMWSYPRLRQASDTRAELYGPQRLATYADMLAARPGWVRSFDSYHPVAALLPQDSPLGAALLAQRGWTIAASDETVRLLLSPGP